MMEQEAPFSCRGSREVMHIAMAAVLGVDDWWHLSEKEVIGIALGKNCGSLHPDSIINEFRAMRMGRGLPAIAEAIP